MNLNYDLQKVEKTLADAVLAGKVSANVFKSQRPSIAKNLSDFVVVSVPTLITDLSTYGRCTSRIEMFVKNDSNGLKNSAKFSLMYAKLCNVFPIKNDTYLFDMHPGIVALGNDNYGFHVQALNISTLIKAI